MLNNLQNGPIRKIRRWANEQLQPIGLIIVLGHAELGTAIRNIDTDRGFLRGVKAELSKPAGGMRPPSARVHHKVRGQGMRRARLLVAYPADAPIFVDQPRHGALASKRDVGMLQGTLPYTVFEEPTTVAGHIKPEVAWLAHCARDRKRLAIGEIDREFCAGATTHCPKCRQLVDKAGIQRCHDLLST